ncbi:MAG: glycosyl hydrolase [Rhodoferax sp.]|nr:glycosyl hydrolase [Rhodoferax sp.]
MNLAIRTCLAGLLASFASAAVLSQPVKLGAGTYFATPKTGDRTIPPATFRTPAMLDAPAPTAQWYSTVLYNPKPEAIFVQPLTIKPTAAGLEVALPQKQVRPTERRDVEIRYPHAAPLLIAPTAFAPGQSKLAKRGDWSVDISMGRAADDMNVTVAHGVPYAFVKISRGDASVKLSEGASASVHAQDSRVLQVTSGTAPTAHYAVFGPSGGNWKQSSANAWTLSLPSGKGYLSVAVLPDAAPDTFAVLARHAYSFIDNTRVDWAFDASSSTVTSTFSASTTRMEGAAASALLGLYPHQWINNPSVAAGLGAAYDTVRGKIRLLEASSFQTSATYNGFVPFWPGVGDPGRKIQLAELMKTDQRNARRMMLEEGKGPYWQGKGLQRILKLMDVVEQQGDLEGRDRLLELVKRRAESWFTGEGGGYFHYNPKEGTVASYPEEFFTVEQLNDHHFTYGYWIRAAADIALRDPQWASTERFGGMVDLLIADIATAQRENAKFPFLRNFDPYEGHSWASGIGMGELGNNQESSSEAINAWAGLILWGEIKGDKALRDLGLYLYTTEINAINHYWFDIYGQVLAPEYKNVEVSQLFGGMYSHNTWWIDDPRQIKGINLLPITTASTYLGQDPAFVKKNVASLAPETAIYNARGFYAKPPDIWQDLFAQYLGLADPDAGLAAWNRWGSFELGDTRSHALHHLQSLKEMGTPDFGVTANTTLYAVFKRADGQRSYLAYNAGKSPLTVTFSDGKTMVVESGKLLKE